MAPAISKKPLLSDLVAQIGKVPSNHIRPVGDRLDLANVDNESGAGIPLIDLKMLDANGPERRKVVEAIGRACESDGFFMASNHGMPAVVVEGMLRVAREFFHLPESERLKCYSDDPKKAIRLSTSFNVRTEKVSNWRDFLRLHCYPLETFVDQWPSNPPSFRAAAASAFMWEKSIVGSGSALPRWLRKLGGSSSPSLLPVVAASQRQAALWESHSPGTGGFAAVSPRPSSQRRSSAAAESTSISVSEIPLGDSGSFPPPSSLSSASSSPSRNTATTTDESAAPDANGSEEPVRTSGGSGSPPKPSAAPATDTSVATTTDHEDALKVFIMNVAANITLLVNIDDIRSGWRTEWKVVYGIFVLLSFLSTITSICAAWPRANSWARTFSSFCARFGLFVATAVFVVNTTCQLGPFGCVAGVPIAALFVLSLTVVWWKC